MEAILLQWQLHMLTSLRRTLSSAAGARTRPPPNQAIEPPSAITTITIT
jgi:hypothetical protein